MDDVHRIAGSMPHVTRTEGPTGNAVYKVGGKSFVVFRTPRPDAPFPDVIVFWVESEADKLALVQDDGSPFFTTTHFDGYNSVLVRAGDLGRIGVAELTEIIHDAWLARASPRRGKQWLADQDRQP